MLSKPLLFDLKEILICVVNKYRRFAPASSNDIVECFDGEDGCPFLMCVMCSDSFWILLLQIAKFFCIDLFVSPAVLK